MELPIAPVEEILKKSGLRTSDKAVKEFAVLLEEIASDIASEASALAKQAGRKTVLASDIQTARNKI